MKEITRIHLAALPYNIEIAAKKTLEYYVEAIRVALGADDEAMKEIESRIAELLAERGVTGEKVITAADVEAIKTQLGDPKEFAGEDGAGGEAVEGAARPAKRLMRDPANQMIAGVSSGLAAYLGIDTVWVRLAFVVLLFVTSGFMVIIYLVMALVMPEAKTAADRLQMAGKPVTLAALQQEAPAVAKAERDTRIALSILRGIAGATLLLIAIGTLIGMVAVTAQFYPRIIQETPEVMVASVAAGVTGILFVAFCLVLAAMMFRNSWTKKYLVALGVVAFLGVVGLSVFTFGLTMGRGDSYKSESLVERKIDGTALKDATNVSVAANGMEVVYHVTAAEPYAVVKTQHNDTNPEPVVTSIKREGEVVKIDIRRTGQDMCARNFLGCVTYITLDVYGPALTTLEATNGAVRYEAMSQPELTARVGDNNSTITITSKNGTITTLHATAADGGEIGAENANILNLQAEVGSEARLRFGTVKKAELTVPEACKTGNKAEISFERASELRVNGADYQTKTDLPCALVTLNDSND